MSGRCAVLVLLLALAPRVGAEPVARSVVLELKFGPGESVEAGARREVEVTAPRQYGTPQMAPLFFEVTGAEGQVVYAGTVNDPRHTGCAAGSAPAEGSTSVRVPRTPEAKTFTLYRRIPAKDGKPSRQALAKVSL